MKGAGTRKIIDYGSFVVCVECVRGGGGGVVWERASCVDAHADTPHRECMGSEHEMSLALPGDDFDAGSRLLDCELSTDNVPGMGENGWREVPGGRAIYLP